MTDLFNFETPQRPRFPSEPIIRTANITDGYRWQARRAWGSGPCISWTLWNPSDANDKIDDPTMHRMMGFSYRWGYGSLVVTNVYPFIASNQEAFLAWRNVQKELLDSSIWHGNISAVVDAMSECKTHVAAWGNGPSQEDLKTFLDCVYVETNMDEPVEILTPAHEVKWKCLGTTKSGAPIHPLARGRSRVPDSATLIDWKAP